MSAPLLALIGFLLSAVFLANRWKVPGGSFFGSIEENRSALTEHGTFTANEALQKDTDSWSEKMELLWKNSYDYNCLVVSVLPS